jgi:hypothetical protein
MHRAEHFLFEFEHSPKLRFRLGILAWLVKCAYLGNGRMAIPARFAARTCPSPAPAGHALSLGMDKSRIKA